MSTIGVWLGQQPVLLGVLAFVGVVVGAAFGLRGVYRTAQSTDRATDQDREEAWWTTQQEMVKSLRDQYDTSEKRRDEMDKRLDEMSERLGKMQQDLWDCLRERNELRAEVARCNERIREIESQLQRGARRGNGADSAPGVI